ncbi:MAG: peptide chain release factor-like protein, partial [Kingella oralis]
MIYLQLSTGQSPAECQIFARFALRQILREAEAAGVAAELLSQTGSKHGILSTTFAFNGAGAEALAQRWLDTLQWISDSPVRPKHPRKNWYIGVFRMPDMPEMPSESEIEFQTCRSGGKGGQHVNKTESAVRATHKASGIS